MFADLTSPILLIGKGFALLALSIYIVFSLVVVKQVGLMVETVDFGFTWIIKILAWLHLALAIIVFLIALTTL